MKLFLLTDGAQKNRLYVVHEVNFATEEGNKTYYVSGGFDGVVIRKGEQVRTDLLTSQEQYMELKERDF